MWTSPDLLHWTLERVIKPTDTWMGNGTCFATDGQERNGYYYFYFSNKSTNIGVLRAKTPTGPFEDVLKKPLVPSGLTAGFHYDPTILTDDDAARTPYIVYGRRSQNKGTPYYIARLDDDMLHLAQAWATEFEGQNRFSAPGNKELVLSFGMGCTDYYRI